jgi:hypothetical protein
MRIDEAGGGRDHLDAVALELVPGNVDLVAHHRVGAEQQVHHRDVAFYRVGRAIDGPLAETRQVQRRLAQRLGRDGAGVDAHPADHRLALGYGDPLAQLGGLDGGALAGGSGAEHQQVVIVACRSRCRLRAGGNAGKHVVHGPYSPGLWQESIRQIARTG